MVLNIPMQELLKKLNILMSVRNMSVCSPCIWLQSIEQPQVLSVVGEHN
jgi:hypothetical protein